MFYLELIIALVSGWFIGRFAGKLIIGRRRYDKERSIGGIMVRGISIAGRKRNDGIDFYQTPSWATLALLNREKFEGEIIEPCCGAGAISEILEDKLIKSGTSVLSSDIREDDDVYGIGGIDVMSYPEKCCEHLITNPPFFMAQEVIEQSLKMARSKVAMLLKLVFLESLGRYEFFKATPLKNVYVFCQRVNMYPEGIEKPKNSGTIAYAWFVWEHGYKGKPMIDWINERDRVMLPITLLEE